MSQREEDDPSKRKINGLSNHDKDQEHELDMDETLSALLASSLLSPDNENINDISQIAGEYSSLNNTIDELNRYLDRWDERHEQLRTHIREALEANEQDEAEEIQETKDSEDKDPSNSPDTADSTNKTEDNSVINEEKSKKNSDESI